MKFRRLVPGRADGLRRSRLALAVAERRLHTLLAVWNLAILKKEEWTELVRLVQTGRLTAL